MDLAGYCSCRLIFSPPHHAPAVFIPALCLDWYSSWPRWIPAAQTVSHTTARRRGKSTPAMRSFCFYFAVFGLWDGSFFCNCRSLECQFETVSHGCMVAADAKSTQVEEIREQVPAQPQWRRHRFDTDSVPIQSACLVVRKWRSPTLVLTDITTVKSKD